MSYLDHVEKVEGLQPDIESLSTYFAKLVTSKHNQHAIVMIVGAAGKGKSYAAVALAVSTAKKIAEIKGGAWQDYFNFKDNLAVVNKDDIKRVMTSPKKYAVILGDDVGVGWNARNYRDDFNIDLNDTVQTFRPNNNLVILSMQADFLIDKVPRSLAHYIIEMEQAYFDQGFTIAKVQQNIFKQHKGKMYHPYVEVGGNKYIRHIFTKPDDALMIEYEQIRAAQLKRLDEMKTQANENKTGLSPVAVTANVVKTFVDAGIITVNEGCKMAKIGEATYYRHAKRGHVG